MPNIKEFIKKIGSESVSLEEQQQALVEIEQTIKATRQKREEEVGKNAKMVVDALKQIESRLNDKFQELLATPAMVGAPGRDGKDGKDGKDGLPGPAGINGEQGKDGIDGVDGKDGVSVVDAKIDFDGSLVITLSNGDEIDAGLVVPTAVAEQYNAFMTRGDIIPTQSGNSGKYLTTDGSNLAWDQINISTADITGTLPIANGGTGATTAPNARTNLGLGTIATQNANSVAVTGGSIDGTTIGGSTPAAGTFTTLTGNTTSEFGRSSANYWQAIGAATTLTPQFVTLGSDTNIPVTFRSKGTGAVNIAPGSRGVNISNGGTITAITRTAAGSGYTSVPTVAISAPTTAGGVQATATCTLSGDGIATTFTITNAGSGYVEQPTVTFSGGGGSGAAAYAVVGSVSTIKGIGIGTASRGDTIKFVGPSGVNQLELWDVASSDSWLAIQNTQFARANLVAQGNANAQLWFSASGSGYHAFATNGTSLVNQMRITHTASAVNYVQVTGAATTVPPVISAQGSDTNIHLTLLSKGSNGIRFSTNSASNIQAFVSHTASAVNFLQLTGAAAGSSPVLSSQGTDTNIDLNLTTKGTGAVRFNTGAGEQFRVLNTAGTIVNYATATGSATGAAPAFSVAGTDTNIDLALTPKGTGLVRFGTRTATSDVAITGYLEIKDSGGTTRKLAIID